MVEQSGRLDLIQRAAKRLEMEGAAAAPQPAASFDSLPEHVAPGPAVSRDTQPLHATNSPVVQHPQSPEEPFRKSTPTPSPPAPPADPTKPVRLKFNEVRRRGMITPDNLRSNISFEFRAIKRKLLAGTRDQLNGSAITNNLIMVTSALPGEGKTFTATNLAFALAAERDLHVLLIDADVIHPSVGALFDSPEGPGLTDLLNGNCSSVAEAMRRCSDQQNLSVIFSGARDERAPELISSKKAADLFLDISRRYNDRIIIFDTPPVLASSETASLAMYMHQAFMVVAAGTASRDQVQIALDNISACRNISLVFNKAPKWQKMASDYYYYYGNERSAGNSVTP
jgi:protein-tyrosine kinase